MNIEIRREELMNSKDIYEALRRKGILSPYEIVAREDTVGKDSIIVTLKDTNEE